MKSHDRICLKENETVEDLGGGYLIIQGKDEFRFGTDAVKLAAFANVKPGEKIMDLCTGTAIIPLLLHKKSPDLSITGLELQEQIYDMAQRSVRLNSLTSKTNLVLGDVRKIRDSFEAESFQVVTCNPPYMKNNTGKKNQSQSVTIARHELCCSLADCVGAAAYLLPSGGRFYLVHRPERLTDIMTLMREKQLEPKRLAFYSAGIRKPPRLIVIEGQKNRKSGLIVSLHTGEEP